MIAYSASVRASVRLRACVLAKCEYQTREFSHDRKDLVFRYYRQRQRGSPYKCRAQQQPFCFKMKRQTRSKCWARKRQCPIFVTGLERKARHPRAAHQHSRPCDFENKRCKQAWVIQPSASPLFVKGRRMSAAGLPSEWPRARPQHHLSHANASLQGEKSGKPPGRVARHLLRPGLPVALEDRDKMP